MRVLLLTTHLNIGGVAVYTVNLARWLKRKNIEVFVASAGGELVKLLDQDGIKHIFVNTSTKFELNPKLCLAFFKLLKFIKKNKVDIIHGQTRVTQVLACVLAKAAGVKCVSTCHGFFRAKRIGRRFFGAWGDSVIAISDAVKKHLTKDFHVREERVFLVYNGVDFDAFSSMGTEENASVFKNNLGLLKNPVIGSICRLSPVKGLRYLLFAMKDLLADMPDAQLLLVGEGPSKEYLIELAKKLEIEKNIFFAHGTVDTRQFLSIMDIFVFYSLEEGLGLSLLEALAAGKPAIASSVGGIPSIIEDGVTGLLVPPRDAHALKEAMARLLKDRTLGSELAENGRNLVRRKFTLEQMIEGVIDVYEKTIKN